MIEKKSLDLLKTLIGFDTTSFKSNLNLIKFVENYLNQYKIKSELVYDETKNKANLFATIGPNSSGGIVLSGHTDVVPVAKQKWDSDPFQLIEKDEKLYGRGTSDMKSFIGLVLSRVPKMVEKKLSKPIHLAFSYDEEVGCLAGPELAKAIHTDYTEKHKYAIIGEHSLMEPIVGQKGIYILETYVNGSAGHSSRIKQEVSAIHEAMRLILWLENKMNQLIEDNRLDERFHPPHSSIHIGLVNCGIAANVIADKAHFYWDLRTIPMDDTESIVAEFKAFCRQREE